MESEDVCCHGYTVTIVTFYCFQVSQKLRSNVHSVGDATIDLFHFAASAQIAPDDPQAIKDLNYASKVLAEKVK